MMNTNLTLPERGPASVPQEIGRGTILDRWRLPDGTLYLDNAATRPMLPEVAEEMARLMANNPLNASSQHKYGQKAARMLEDARNFFKSELNVPSTGELIFNSGATEGLNMLLKSAYFADPTKNHIVTVKTEHKAVLNTCAYLETIGAEVTYLDVDEWGQVSVSDIEDAIRPTTCAVCVMWLNNETGTFQKVMPIGQLCRNRGVWFLCDTTQAVGKVKVDLDEFGINGAVLSAHKFGGPALAGAVIVDPKLMSPQIHGGGQQMGLRSGTESVACIQAMKMAWELYVPVSLSEAQTAFSTLSSIIGEEVLQIERTGHHSFGFVELNDEVLQSVCVSKGSACSGGVVTPSYSQSVVLGNTKLWRVTL